MVYPAEPPSWFFAALGKGVYDGLFSIFMVGGLTRHAADGAA